MPGKNFSTNQKREKRNKSDFYQTPYSLTRLLMENEKFHGSVLEPAAGEGAIARIVKEYNPELYAWDITQGVDFLEYEAQYHNIITNPPYSLANDFILKAKQIATKKIVW